MEYIERYWRDATPQDAIRQPPMVARFRDHADDGWFVGKLLGCWRDLHGNDPKWGTGNGMCYTTCQVHDAPDPGEGWRLVDVWEETKQEGDEFWSLNGKWKSATSNRFFPLHFYRRRIEQPKPKYVPFTWEDREQLRGRLITFVDRNRTVEFRCESFAVDDDGLIVNDAYADWLCKNAVFVDTKEPVGKRVV